MVAQMVYGPFTNGRYDVPVPVGGRPGWGVMQPNAPAYYALQQQAAYAYPPLPTPQQLFPARQTPSFPAAQPHYAAPGYPSGPSPVSYPTSPMAANPPQGYVQQPAQPLFAPGAQWHMPHQVRHPNEQDQLLSVKVSEHPRTHNHLEVLPPAVVHPPHAPSSAKPHMIPVMPMRQQVEPVEVEARSVQKESQAAHSNDDGHDHAAHAGKKPARWKPLLTAAGMVGLGLALHSLPARRSTLSAPLISSDWKDIARIVLGITAVQQFNKAFDWKPAPWLSAIQAVAVMNPIATGVLTKEGLLSRKNLGQIAVMSVVVAPMVQLAATVDKKVIPWLKENFSIPTWLPRAGMIVGMMAVGMSAYPKIFNWVARQGILGKAALAEAEHQLAHAKQNAAAGLLMCYRSCCAGSIVCLSELGEILSSFMNGMSGKKKSDGKAAH